MIPILYNTDETDFVSNGLCRLTDAVSCIVTEERNGIYECDLEYPLSGAHFDQIIIGRIIGVTHDESEDVQPFDIVSYTRPIQGVVTFHAVHISYRQSYLVARGTNINSLSAALNMLRNATPTNPFTYTTDKTSSAYLGSADGIPKTVRQYLGGVEGSILDAYGGEYEWDKFEVKLLEARGELKAFKIRSGVNMLEYEDNTDSQGVYSSAIGYWTNGEKTVVGARVDSGNSTPTGRGETIPLDLSEKFETAPTAAQLNAAAVSYMNNNQTYLAGNSIKVEFARLQELESPNFRQLYSCKLCDMITVVFPDYKTNGLFKIVKTEWDALSDRYKSMELGTLSTSLSEALGISDSFDQKNDRDVIPEYAHGRSVSITAAANNYKDQPITFGKTFTTVPTVVTSIYSTATVGAIGSLSCSAINVTETGCTIRVFNAGSASRSPAVDWIAIN